MWKSFDEKPDYSGWILLSTNKGLAYAKYNRENHKLGQIYLLGDMYNTADKIHHWAKIDHQPDGDFDPNSVGFPKTVK